jgi:MFS family permease
MLFGYDIGVISGAEKPITAQWKLSSGVEEFAVAAVLIGSIIGGMVGGKLADRISRRYSLMIMAVIYTVGAIETALAPNVALFIVFRIVVGIAVGASSMIVPTYIAELSPDRSAADWSSSSSSPSHWGSSSPTSGTTSLSPPVGAGGRCSPRRPFLASRWGSACTTCRTRRAGWGCKAAGTSR